MEETNTLKRRVKVLCSPKKWYSQIRTCNVHRIFVSLWLSLSFIGLGSSLVVFGPTLLDLASHLSVGIGVLAAMLAVRAVGHAIGSVGSGILFDKLPRHSYTFLVGILLTGIAITVTIPLSVHIAMLTVLMLLNGVAFGSLDNGAHAVLMRLWGDKVGPCMQVLHFSFSLGAFIAPLISKPFISEEGSDGANGGYNLTNFTCLDLNLDGYWNDTQEFGSGRLPYAYNSTNCIEFLNNTCFNFTADSNLTTAELSPVIIEDLTNCSNRTTAPSVETYLLGWPYWISASFFIVPLLAFAYYAIKFTLPRCRTVKDSGDSASTPTAENTKQTAKCPLVYKVTVFSLLFLFTFIYVGLEVTFGTLIFTASVTGELNFSKPDAAILTSVFWGTFCFMRLFSVTLALLKVRASVMMTMNLSGSLLAATIMVFFPHNATAIWLGAAILGASYASIYPTTMVWLGQNVEATGKATSVVVTGGTLGDTILPAVVGALIAHVSPDSLIYFTFCGIIISVMIVAALFIAAHVQKRRTLGLNHQKYRRLEKTERKTEENGDTELAGGDNDGEEHLLDTIETEL